MPLGVLGLIFGRPFRPFSRAISSRCSPTTFSSSPTLPNSSTSRASSSGRLRPERGGGCGTCAKNRTECRAGASKKCSHAHIFAPVTRMADTTSPSGRMLMTIFAGNGEFGRTLIASRTTDGRRPPRRAVVPSAGQGKCAQTSRNWRGNSPETGSRSAPLPGPSTSTPRRFTASSWDRGLCRSSVPLSRTGLFRAFPILHCVRDGFATKGASRRSSEAGEHSGLWFRRVVVKRPGDLREQARRFRQLASGISDRRTLEACGGI